MTTSVDGGGNDDDHRECDYSEPHDDVWYRERWNGGERAIEKLRFTDALRSLIECFLYPDEHGRW